MKRIIHHPTVKKHAPQLLKFALAGGTGFITDFATLALLTRVFSFPSEASFLLSACVGATCVFFLNKIFTFKNRDKRLLRQALKFASVYGPAVVANFFLSTFFYWIGIPDLLAKPMAVALIAMWNYLMSHHFIFKHHEA